MCQEVKKKCHCGFKEATFHLRDNVMGQEVIEGLYCPACSLELEFDHTRMIKDNAWVIVYDMDLARMFAVKRLRIDPAHVSPAFIFDEGYMTWREMYPGETIDSAEARKGIIAIKNRDPKEYLATINSWAVERIQRLKAQGWRKAVLTC